jgi:hypothetical protein
MQQNRFVVLTGHLNDYPLADLVGILRHQQKTGRLLIEYPKSPAMFYFDEGELVDAQLDRLRGLQAICVALAQPPSCFNFNPLIRAPQRSIESSQQKVVSELMGCWDATGLEIEATSMPPVAAQPALLTSSAATFANGTDTNTTQALVISTVSQRASEGKYSRPVVTMAAAGLMMLGLSTVIAVTGGFGKKVSSNQILMPTTSAVALSASTDHSVQPIGGEFSQAPPKTEPRSEVRTQRATKGKEPAFQEPSNHRESSTLSANKAQSDETDSRRAKSAGADVADSPRAEQKSNEVATSTQSVKVVLQIEGGRVAQASIANHKSGMEDYEALALRIARQRRYPPSTGGQDTVVIKVNQPR